MSLSTECAAALLSFKYPSIGIFSHHSRKCNSGQNHVLAKRLSQLMTQQKSVLVFAVQDASSHLILLYLQSLHVIFHSSLQINVIIMVAELLSLVRITGVSWKWLVMLLKLESDLLVWYVYSMYTKKKTKIEKLVRSYIHEKNSERTFNWFTSDFFYTA